MHNGVSEKSLRQPPLWSKSKPGPNKSFLSLAGAAWLLGVDPSEVTRMVDRGEIPFVRLGGDPAFAAGAMYEFARARGQDIPSRRERRTGAPLRRARPVVLDVGNLMRDAHALALRRLVYANYRYCATHGTPDQVIAVLYALLRPRCEAVLLDWASAGRNRTRGRLENDLFEAYAAACAGCLSVKRVAAEVRGRQAARPRCAPAARPHRTRAPGRRRTRRATRRLSNAHAPDDEPDPEAPKRRADGAEVRS